MNTAQRLAIFIGLLVVALMLIFPPMTGDSAIGCQSSGYGFLLNSRSTYVAALDSHTGRYERDSAGISRLRNGWCYWHVDQELLKYQIVIASLLTAGIAVVLGKRKSLTT